MSETLIATSIFPINLSGGIDGGDQRAGPALYDTREDAIAATSSFHDYNLVGLYFFILYY